MSTLYATQELPRTADGRLVRIEAPEQRFWRHVRKAPDDGCWEWTASCRQGYGQFGVTHGEIVCAHRYAYELAFGPIPDELEVLHRCDNRPCVRWDHLFLGTQGDNVRDMHAKGRDRNQFSGRTACDAGHPRLQENVYADGACRICHAEKCRRRRAQERERRFALIYLAGVASDRLATVLHRYDREVAR